MGQPGSSGACKGCAAVSSDRKAVIARTNVCKKIREPLAALFFVIIVSMNLILHPLPDNLLLLLLQEHPESA